MDLRRILMLALRASAYVDVGRCLGWLRVHPSTFRHGQPDDDPDGDAGAGRPADIRKDKGSLKVSEEAVALIRHFEGCSLDAYLCPAGVWTIGYGHTGDVKQGDVIDQEKAEALLIEDLEEFEGYVTALCERSLEQCQFDALVSFVFNLGPGNFKSSTLLRRLNAGDLRVVPDEIRRWNKAGGRVLDGLVKRREAEALMFQGLDWRSIV